MTPQLQGSKQLQGEPYEWPEFMFQKEGDGEIHTKRPEEGTGSGARAGREGQGQGPLRESFQVQSHDGNPKSV